MSTFPEASQLRPLSLASDEPFLDCSPAAQEVLTSSFAAGPKDFHLGDVARAALARPRRSIGHAGWMSSSGSDMPSSSSNWPAGDEQDDASSIAPSSPALSAFGSSSTLSSPFTSPPSSCPITPSSSSEGWTVPPSSLSPPSSPPAATIRRRPSRFAREHQLPPSISLPALPISPSADRWAPEGFSLRLLFPSARAPGAPSSPTAGEDEDNSAPPAFFPSASISFSPRLRVTNPDGLPYSALGGMHLGVTGICETLNPDGSIKTKRMLADFCTDLSSGLGIWKSDAERAYPSSKVEGKEARLPMGTYKLPLTMQIPNSERLPPSFECAQFRIHYTMSIALFSSALSSTGTPLRLKVFSVPFHILPSTLPTPAPELPVLTHDHKKNLLSSLLKSFSFSSTPKSESGYHLVFPSIPTSHISPGSHASIPVSLRIVDRPLEATDLYIRLALVRKTYVRESTHSSLAQAVEDEWGLGTGVSAHALGYPEETLVEPWCREEKEIVSRWGWVPYSARKGADPMEKGEVLIQDISLPLSGLIDEMGETRGWEHGYSTSFDIAPTALPSLAHGDGSWFSPAFRNRPPVAKEYQKHVHVSSRFFLVVEIGFATPALKETLQAVGAASPDMEIPPPTGFTKPRRPATSKHSGASLTNPFVSASSRPSSSSATPSSPSASLSSSTSSSSSSSNGPTSPFNIPLAFPGKMRELVIPLTIGSVAEPQMSCIAAAAESSSQRAAREAREERGEDTRAEGEGPEGAWMCAPPKYDEALRSAPAYLY